MIRKTRLAGYDFSIEKILKVFMSQSSLLRGMPKPGRKCFRCLINFERQHVKMV